MSEIVDRNATEPVHEEPVHEQVAKDEKKAVTWTEAIVPAIGMAYAIYYLSTIAGLPVEAKMSGTLISIVVFILMAALCARWVRDARRHGVKSGIWTLLGQGSVLHKRMAVLALLIAYVYLLPHLGYFIDTLAFLVAAMAVLGVRGKPLVLVPLIMTTFGYGFFILMLGIDLPQGVVGHLVEAVSQGS